MPEGLCYNVCVCERPIPLPKTGRDSGCMAAFARKKYGPVRPGGAGQTEKGVWT